MEVFILLPPILVIYFMFGHMNGQYAKDRGRSYWLWFFISFILPVISTIILINLKNKK